MYLLIDLVIYNVTRGDPEVVGKRRITSQTFHSNSIIIDLQAMPHRQNQEKSNMNELLQYQITGVDNDWYSSRYNAAKSPGILETTSNRRNDGSIPR